MQLLQELRSALNQKSVMRNVLFCLAIILLMHLLYGVYRSSSVLQEGKKGKKGKGKNKKCKGKKRHSKKCAKSKCKGKNRKRYAVVSKKKKGRKKRWKCTKCKGGKIVKKVGKNKIKCVKKPPGVNPNNYGTVLNGSNYDSIKNNKIAKINITTIGDFTTYEGDVSINGTDYPNLKKIIDNAFSDESKPSDEYKGEKISKKITINGSFPKLESIGSNAFFYCGDHDSEIIITNAPMLKTIGNSAFRWWWGVVKLDGSFPNLERIGDAAFTQGWSQSRGQPSGVGIVDIKDANQLEYIGENAFLLAEVKLTLKGTFKKLETIGSGAFLNCKSTEIDINDAKLLKNIDGSTFGGYARSSEDRIVKLSGDFSNLVKIADAAFKNVSNDSSINITTHNNFVYNAGMFEVADLLLGRGDSFQKCESKKSNNLVMQSNKISC